MARKVADQGAVFAIAFAREKSGACPACEFFDGLAQLDKATLMALFRIAGDHGKFLNPEKFGDLSGGLFEFKSFHLVCRLLLEKNKSGLILITHVFSKKKAKTPKEEIAPAWRIDEEDQAQTKLTIVGKTKR